MTLQKCTMSTLQRTSVPYLEMHTAGHCFTLKHADKLLAHMNLTVFGAIDRASLIGTGDEVGFAHFEPYFYSGWAYVKSNMHPELTTRMKTVINECWKVKVKQK